MAWRKGHGNGKGTPRIEVLPPDELPRPIPAPPAPPTVPLKFDEKGRFADSETAREAGRRGGQASAVTKRAAKFLRQMGISLTADVLKPYREGAEEWIEQVSREYAQLAGGNLGAGPRSLIINAGWNMMYSAIFKDLAIQQTIPDVKIVKEASLLGDAMRQNLMAAYELAVRQAQARPKEAFDPLAGYLEPSND